MKRQIYSKLLEWKNRSGRKPLVLLGARQVGKTYILKEFGTREYSNLVYINCHRDSYAAKLFRDPDASRILDEIRNYYAVKIVPGETLLFLDEIQEVRNGLASLKYFCEDFADVHVAVAGSLLGINLHEEESYPVGKVDTLRLYPMSFSGIPAQLARENKKFVFGAVRKGARVADYELAIQWLADAGIVYKVYRCKEPVHPLKFYTDNNAFKLYMLDCGLLGCMSNASPTAMMVGNTAFVEFKGALTENFVLQQIRPLTDEGSVFYFSKDNSTQEVDFLMEKEERMIPIEVKSEVSMKSKSLSGFINCDHKDKGLKGLRLSLLPYQEQGWMENVPLYATEIFLR